MINDSQHTQKSTQQEIKDILNKYRGLREEELCLLNPWYSCVICEKLYSNRCKFGIIGGSCETPEELNIDTFALKYDFKVVE